MLKKRSRLKPPPFAATAAAPSAANDDAWPMFANALSDLSKQDRTIMLGVLRRLEAIERDHGPEVAEATLEKIIASFSQGARAVML
jgi:hypothetical protein